MAAHGEAQAGRLKRLHLVGAALLTVAALGALVGAVLAGSSEDRAPSDVAAQPTSQHERPATSHTSAARTTSSTAGPRSTERRAERAREKKPQHAGLPDFTAPTGPDPGE